MSKQKILLVEDDGFLASIYSQKLELEGYEVTFATNGEDGLKLAQKDHPDLLLLDLLMPKMDGFSVLKALKEDPKTKNAPVILLTNLGQEEDIARGKEMGSVGYLVKANITPAEVVEQVKKQLANLAK